jgi:predicted nucleic acid-binding protein
MPTQTSAWSAAAGGTPAKLLGAAIEGRIELISSTPPLAELQVVLMRPKFDKQLARKGLTVADVCEPKNRSYPARSSTGGGVGKVILPTMRWQM